MNGRLQLTLRPGRRDVQAVDAVPVVGLPGVVGGLEDEVGAATSWITKAMWLEAEVWSVRTNFAK